MGTPVKKITIEIDEDIYLKIKAIAELLNPGVDLLPAPGKIIKFLVEKYLAKAGSSSPS